MKIVMFALRRNNINIITTFAQFLFEVTALALHIIFIEILKNQERNDGPVFMGLVLSLYYAILPLFFVAPKFFNNLANFAN